jgi:hypothetical protein
MSAGAPATGRGLRHPLVVREQRFGPLRVRTPRKNPADAGFKSTETLF